MKNNSHHIGRRALAMLLVVLSIMSMLSMTAFAGQEDGYHDPAERWMNASNRTNELDVNATVTHETFYCYGCGQHTSFQVWRTPEYTKDGQTAMTRNVRYSDGTLIGGSGTGTILDGTPGVNATYTGYHWTKSCCENCGTMNGNMGIGDYSFSKNVYWLYDCATAFTEYLDDVVTYEYADDTYHTKTTEGGSYCEFCYGTRHTKSTVLERHDLHVDILPQIANQRFAIVEHCHDCEYTGYSFVAAKAVVADYYGVVDGQAHTLTISDLSEPGVTAVIRYGNSAETCTMTTPPSYTEEGQYTVYYQITYTYQGVSMTENGVAYVAVVTEPTCTEMGYTTWNCSHCGKTYVGKYTEPNGHQWDEGAVIAEPCCTGDGVKEYVCLACGEKRNDRIPATGHTPGDPATCTDPQICEVCGAIIEKAHGHNVTAVVTDATCLKMGWTTYTCEDCGLTYKSDYTDALGHDYVPVITEPTCTEMGYTTYTCSRCGDSYVTDYVDALGHEWDEGRKIISTSCNSEGLIDHRCVRCD